jgi:hypothetical protein
VGSVVVLLPFVGVFVLVVVSVVVNVLRFWGGSVGGSGVGVHLREERERALELERVWVLLRM